MRIAPAVDRAPTVIATALGVYWRLAIVCFVLGVAPVVIMLLIDYWWVVVLTVLCAFIAWFLVLWFQVGHEIKQKRR